MLRFFFGPLVLMFLLAILLSAATAFAGLAVSPGTPAHTHTDANTGGGTLAVSGTVSSTKACYTGYTRVSPNFCLKDEEGGAVFSLSASGCTLSTAPGPTDVKALLLTVSHQVISANAVGFRTSTARIYAPSDTTCALGGQVTFDTAMREFAAVAAGTSFFQREFPLIVKTSATGVFPVQWQAGGVASAIVAGYFD